MKEIVAKLAKKPVYLFIILGCLIVIVAIVLLVQNNRGQYMNNVLTSSIKCASGKYPSNGKCITCPKGSYCSNNKKYSCGTGKVSNAGAKNARECFVGWICPKCGRVMKGSAKYCGSCGAAKASCKNGQAYYNGKCITCPKGNYCTGGVGKKCPVGTYQDKAGQSSCIKCTGNKTTNGEGSTSSSACVSKVKTCSSGYYSLLGKCVQCPKGSYCKNNKKYSCGAGKVSNAGAKNASECFVGWICPKCGRVMKGSTNYCGSCGAVNPAKASTTKTCSAGQYLSSGNCVTCPKGSYCNNNKKYACPKGKFQNKTGQSSCILCPSGKTTAKTGATSLSQCQASK